MKRRFSIVFILVTALLVAVLIAFGHNGGKDTKEYLDILQSGTYSLSGDGTYDGNYYMTLSYVDGENYNIRYRNSNDSSFRFLYNNGTLYKVIDNLKLYGVAPADAIPHSLVSNIMDYDFSSAKYSKSGSTTLYGEKYKYDTYTLNKKNGEEATLNIYIDPQNELLYAIALSSDIDIIININFLTPGLPEDSYVEIPEDFEEVDYWQLEYYPQF